MYLSRIKWQENNVNGGLIAVAVPRVYRSAVSVCVACLSHELMFKT